MHTCLISFIEKESSSFQNQTSQFKINATAFFQKNLTFFDKNNALFQSNGIKTMLKIFQFCFQILLNKRSLLLKNLELWTIELESSFAPNLSQIYKMAMAP